MQVFTVHLTSAAIQLQNLHLGSCCQRPAFKKQKQKNPFTYQPNQDVEKDDFIAR